MKVTPSGGGAPIREYEYDARFRRIKETAGTTTTDFYYSANWQVLEEHVDNVLESQYTWSPTYIDALILRDRNADGNSANGLEERLWTLQDANYNVTALVNFNGVVVERYAYDPFGSAQILDNSWNTRGSSAYSWDYLHQGLRYDAGIDKYHVRFRDYDPQSGRWLSMDPIGFAAGDVNLYRGLGNKIINRIDPLGLSDWEPASKLMKEALIGNYIDFEGKIVGIKSVGDMRLNAGHTPGAGGMTVPEHYWVNVELDNGRKHQIRVYPDGTPFTPQEYADVDKGRTGRADDRRRRIKNNGSHRRGTISGPTVTATGITAVITAGALYLALKPYDDYVTEGGRILEAMTEAIALCRSLQFVYSNGSDIKLDPMKPYTIQYRQKWIKIWTETEAGEGASYPETLSHVTPKILASFERYRTYPLSQY